MYPLSTSPSNGPVPFPKAGGPEARLLSKRTMEIQAEEGIHMIRPSPPVSAQSSSAFNPFNEAVRSKTPELRGNHPFLDNLGFGGAVMSADGRASGDPLPSPIGSHRRSRADTLPSSLAQLNLSEIVKPTTTAQPPPRPEPTPATNAPPPASTLRTSLSSTSLRASLTRNRGTSLNLPPTALKEAFGPGVYTSAWLSGGLEDKAMPSPIATRGQIEEMNYSLAKTLDYLGLDEACMSPLEPRRLELNANVKPVHPAVMDLQSSGRIRSFSLTNADLESEETRGASVPRITNLAHHHTARGRTVSNSYADTSYAGPGPSALSESISASQLLRDNGPANDGGFRAASPAMGLMSNGPHLSRSHTPVGGMSTAAGSAFGSRSHTPTGTRPPMDGPNGSGRDRNSTGPHSRRGPSASGDAFSRDGSGSHDSVSDTIHPTRSLWVGNVDPGLTTADLMTYFSPFGQIESLRLLPDKECAFINFARVEDAVKARDEMQNGKIGNCVVRVGFGKGDNYAMVDAQAMQPTRAIWIGNLSSSTTSASLQSVFSAFGPIESARVLTHKNCGFVNFDKLEDAVRAKKAMNGKEIADSVVRIGYAKVPAKSDLGGRTRVVSTASPMPSRFLTPWPTPRPSIDPSVKSADILELGASFIIDEQLVAYNYLHAVPPLPEPTGHRRLDQARLREIRKRLDAQPSMHDVEMYFNELFPVCVDLCTDYIGNTIIQKFMDLCGPDQRYQLIEAVAPYTASIGTHKNGTWAIQKMIESARTPMEMAPFMQAVKPVTPPLMLDQLGNYVVQCCLRFGPERNQFIFEAIHARCWEIAQGRYGARAIRTCLEHQSTTRQQQKLVVIALVNNAVALSTNTNGSLLINWFLDSSGFYGRHQVLAPRLADHLGHLCTHKLGSLIVLKLVNQKAELPARDLLLGRLFFDPSPSVLEDVLTDQVHGVALVQKILAGNALNDAQKRAIAENVRVVLTHLQVFAVQGYRRLLEEIDHILHTSLASLAAGTGDGAHIPSMPLRQQSPSQVPFAGNGYNGMVPMASQPSPNATGFPYNNMLMYNPMYNPYTYGMMGMPAGAMVNVNMAQAAMMPPGVPAAAASGGMLLSSPAPNHHHQAMDSSTHHTLLTTFAGAAASPASGNEMLGTPLQEHSDSATTVASPPNIHLTHRDKTDSTTSSMVGNEDAVKPPLTDSAFNGGGVRHINSPPGISSV
ncbi:hypothetical protein H4R34_000066 [Dimargaris verticillata]|uniref:Uncharacterized protein n=1 Tax=Dimargaris verticillata TaxID=2761393 RepID=A0A9W8B636_9FUNG|nr:hypothetical protein H4R34_000066 [Dimargaris verticillata]